MLDKETNFILPPDVRLAQTSDVPELRRLVNDAYRELADLGLNFTGAYQDERITANRMRSSEVFLLYRHGALSASINLARKELDNRTSCLYINQLAVRPALKRQGIGSYLLKLAEHRALALGVTRLRLDTAIPASHLVSMYSRMGYSIVGETQWEGKAYRSYIMEKQLTEVPPHVLASEEHDHSGYLERESQPES